MFILHLALGGCLKAPPIDFGITADSGGHLAYVVDAALMQADLPGVDRVSIVTRLFRDDDLPVVHGERCERVGARLTIDRIDSGDHRYLEKEALAADLPAFTQAFCRHLAGLPVMPDVIHAHFADAAAVAIEARRLFGIPFVYTPHALAIDKRRQGLGGAELDTRITAERAAIAAADALIVSTQDEAERQVPGYGVAVEGRIHCLPPGVPRRADTDGEPTLVDQLGTWLDRPDLPILLAIARPVEKKNLVALVRAFAAEPALYERANLVILAGQHGGQSSDEERAVLDALHALAASPALRGRIALPPRHGAADVTALYRRAAAGGVFVNPALHEPFGLTLIEAAAAGVPVVATRNGGPAEIVARIGHGLLVDPRDEPGIAAACRGVIENAALHARLSRAARAGSAGYDWGRYAGAALDIYAAIRGCPALLACDIDNTLTGSVEGAAAFARWRRESGLPFVVATGRSFAEARAVLAQWRLPEPDAFIVDVGTRILRPAGQGGWQACAAFTAALDCNWDRAAVRAAIAPLGIEAQPATTEGAHKLSFFGNAEDAALIRTTLADQGLAARVVFSHGRLIDVLSPGGGKAAAIAAYAAGLGLALRDCIAAGDSGNDLDMLDACGFAIVVANASEELAGLAPRAGLYRATKAHAAGVVEGLARLGLTTPAVQVAA